jgi:hypothetical protein
MVIRAVQAAAELTPDFEVNRRQRRQRGRDARHPRRTGAHLSACAGRAPREEPRLRRCAADRVPVGHQELIFYTDGDAQYDPAELSALWARMTPDADLVNGYKISRSDPLHRIIIGRLYHHIVSVMFGLTVRDVDCDFRLMRRTIFERINLEKTSGVICLEMMKKIEDAGFRIVEVPVHHYHRAFGKSQFFNVRRIAKTGVDVLRLWFALVIRRQHLRPDVRPLVARGDAADRAYPSSQRP